MVITQHPSELHTAFNPCIIKVTSIEDSTITLQIALGLITDLDNRIGDIITVERECFNGYCYFDIQRILRNAMSSGVVAIAGSLCWIDKQFFVEYSVFDMDNTFIFNATAINAVAQVQETSNLTDRRGHFMTRFDKLKRYTGYPLEIVAFSFRTGQTSNFSSSLLS